MAKKRYNVEDIIHKLREAEIELAKGRTTPEACKSSRSPSRPTTAGARSTGA